MATRGLRSPSPEKTEMEESVKYLSPKGTANRALLPQKDGGDSDRSVGRRSLLLRREKKALKCTQEGFPAVGLTGIYSWKDREERKADRLIPDIEALAVSGQESTS